MIVDERLVVAKASRPMVCQRRASSAIPRAQKSDGSRGRQRTGDGPGWSSRAIACPAVDGTACVADEGNVSESACPRLHNSKRTARLGG